MRGVSVHPGVYSGEPTLEGSRMPVLLVVEVYWESGLTAIMDGWDIGRRDVLVACWYMARHSRRRVWSERFKDWLPVADDKLWHSVDWVTCPLPPTLKPDPLEGPRRRGEMGA